MELIDDFLLKYLIKIFLTADNFHKVNQQNIILFHMTLTHNSIKLNTQKLIKFVILMVEEFFQLINT